MFDIRPSEWPLAGTKIYLTSSFSFYLEDTGPRNYVMKAKNTGVMVVNIILFSDDYTQKLHMFWGHEFICNR